MSLVQWFENNTRAALQRESLELAFGNSIVIETDYDWLSGFGSL